MSLKSIYLIVLTILPCVLFGQLNFEWAFQTGSTKSDFVSSALLDSGGNLWSFTIYSDTTDLDPGLNVDQVVPVRSRFVALSKFDADGLYLNSLIFDAGTNPGGELLEIKDDKMQLIIYFTDSLTYSYQGNQTTIAIRTGDNVCLLTMDLSGQLLKQFIIPVRHAFYISNAYALSDGSTILGGAFTDTFSFDPGNSPLSVISNGGYDALVARLDADYNVQWLKTIGSVGDDFLEDLSLPKDKFYFTLVHEETLTVQTADGQKTFTSNGDDNNVYGYFNLDGSIQKAFGFGGDLGDQIRTISPDDEGNMYISGYFEGEVNFQHPALLPVFYTSENEPDGFIAKYAPDGSLVWTRIITDSDYGGMYTMNLERGNELYLTGSFAGIADLNPGPDSIIVDAGDRGDIYTIKFNLEGDMMWVYSFPGTGFAGIRSLLVGTPDKVYLQGYTFDTLDCDPGMDEFLILTNGGSDLIMIGLTEENVISATDRFSHFTTMIYPNPSSDEIHIKSEFPVDHLLVYSMDGNALNLPVQHNGEEYVINLRGLAPGMYVVHSIAAEKSSVVRIIKP
jgi:hypothetical protein